MRNTQESHRRKVNPQQTLRQLKISSSRLSNGKNVQFKPPKSMQNLLKVLTFKNNKISEQRVQNLLQNDCRQILERGSQQQINSFIQSQMMIEKQTPFSQRNLLAQFQSNYNIDKSSNTLEIFYSNRNIKKQAKDTVALQNLQQKRRKQRQNRDVEEENDKINSNCVDLTFAKLSLQNDSKLSEYFMQTAKRRVYKKQLLSAQRTLEIELYQQINKTLFKFFQSNSTFQQLAIQLRRFSRLSKVMSIQTFYCIFTGKLCQKLSQSKALNFPSIFEFQHQKMIENYYETHVNLERKLIAYSLVKYNDVIKSNWIGKLNGAETETTESGLLWCRLLMILFSMENGKNNLFFELKKSGQECIIPLVQTFYQQNSQNNDTIKQLKQLPIYQHNIFHRIFIKILCHEDLDTSQLNALNQKERQILLYIRLKYGHEFYKTIEYQNEKNTLYGLLKEAIRQNRSKNHLQKISERIIILHDFDQVYFDLLSQQRSMLSPLQLIFLAKIFVDNNKLLNHSMIKLQKWLTWIVEKPLKELAKQLSGQNTSVMINLIVEILSSCEVYLGKPKIHQTMLSFIRINDRFISYPEEFSLITTKLDIKWQQIEQSIINSINTQQSYPQAIAKYLERYIDFRDEAFSICQKNLNSMKMSAVMHQSIKALNEKEEKVTKQKMENLLKHDLLILQQQNNFFIVGLKLMTRYQVKMLAQFLQIQNSKQTQENKDALYIQKLRVIIKKTRQIIGRLKLAINTAESTGIKQSSLFNQQDKPHERMAKIEQVQRFIDLSTSLIQISEILMIFTHLHKCFSADHDRQGFLNTVSCFEKFKTDSTSLKTKLCQIFENMEKLGIVDETCGYKLLFEYLGKLAKKLGMNNPKQSRKINPAFRDHNTYLIAQMLRICEELEMSMPGIDQEVVFQKNDEVLEKITKA